MIVLIPKMELVVAPKGYSLNASIIPDCFAAANGCNAYAVIGRGVYGASDPGEAARKFADEALGFA